MNAQTDQDRLDATRDAQHPNRLFCGQEQRQGLCLDFRARTNGDVSATFACRKLFQGYPGLLHGGVTCSLLDAAMTNCLFAQGIAAVTGEMTVRFHAPVTVDSTAEVVGALMSAQTPLLVVVAQARLLQDGVIKATATAKFVKRTVGAMFTEAHCNDVAESPEHDRVSATHAHYAKTRFAGEGGV